MAVWSVPKLGTELLKKCGTHFEQFRDCFGWLCHNLYNKLLFGVYEAGNGHGFRFHKVKPMLGEWAAHGQPTVRF